MVEILAQDNPEQNNQDNKDSEISSPEVQDDNRQDDNRQDDNRQDSPVQDYPAQDNPVEETPLDKNIRNLRLGKEKAERERDELLKRYGSDELLKRMEVIETRLNPQLAAPQEEDYKISPDDLVEGKHLGKYDKKIKQLENQLTENQLKTQYPDFDKVVNHENIKLLSEANPALAQTLRSNSDLYSQAITAYTLIKNLGIYREDTFNNDREKVAKNNAKPRPLTSVSPQQSDSPLSRANAFADGLTDELKQKLYKEMMDSRKNY